MQRVPRFQTSVGMFLRQSLGPTNPTVRFAKGEFLNDLPKFGSHLPKKQKDHKLEACNPLFLILNSWGG